MVPRGQNGRGGHQGGGKGGGETDLPGMGIGDVDLEMALGLAVLIDPSLSLVIKHPERVQIVSIAHRVEVSPSEYSKLADIPLSIASGHFRALRDADFLELVNEVPAGGTVKHMYRAKKRAYFSADDWGKLAESIQEGVGAAVLQDFNAVVIESMEAGTFFKRPETVLYWLALLLDEISWPEFIKVLAWTITEVEELVSDTVKRHANGETDGLFNAVFAIAGFEIPDEPASKPPQVAGQRKPNRGAKTKCDLDELGKNRRERRDNAASGGKAEKAGGKRRRKGKS
jgi:DNA-binding transcriptional ArsR family regulator